MEFSGDINALKKLRKASWKFQQSFRTPAPIENLGSFVTTIVFATPSPGIGSFTLGDAVIFADHLKVFFARHCLEQRFKSGMTVRIATRGELEGLLVAAFSDAVDFLFAPEKKPFVFYADHDQFTTFFAQTRSSLNRIVEPLVHNGFHRLPDYQRQL
jgi:hypothetical protein